MEFTREPIIESVIIPKEGCKLVVRSSKHAGIEEYFVDAVEMVSFGRSLFYRSKERPKAFLVPATDYEIVEVREARMVLKSLGRDTLSKSAQKEKQEAHKAEKAEKAEKLVSEVPSLKEEVPAEEIKVDKKRERRRHLRRRRLQEGVLEEAEALAVIPESAVKTDVELPPPPLAKPSARIPEELSSLLRPPPTLISETISRYKENALFRGAFFTPEEKAAAEAAEAAEEEESFHEETLPSLGSLASEEEEIARLRDEKAYYELEEATPELFEEMVQKKKPHHKRASEEDLETEEALAEEEQSDEAMQDEPSEEPSLPLPLPEGDTQ